MVPRESMRDEADFPLERLAALETHAGYRRKGWAGEDMRGWQQARGVQGISLVGSSVRRRCDVIPAWPLPARCRAGVALCGWTARL